ncbi:MAG: hypothetical protein PHW24_00120 [Candidatus Moranbacteria bacterium]|nr:hypothetical protein [Candidatus Moranbacteria bacterium]
MAAKISRTTCQIPPTQKNAPRNKAAEMVVWIVRSIIPSFFIDLF